jgi:3-deoxy-manno-octulosonate cytidylyltransferase (CMP-KDO synthetase)
MNPRLNPAPRAKASRARAVVVIPARMAATRLPGKPLADIHGRPMIVHVMRAAQAAGIGPVVVACAEAEVAAAVEAAGGQAVMTRPDHPSGSDRIFEAVERLDPERRYDVVVNLQGDLPHVKPETLAAVLKPLADPEVDIATLAFRITDESEIDNPNVVKVAIDLAPGGRIGRAVDFGRKPISEPRWPASRSRTEGRLGPSGWRPGDSGAAFYHHVGIYAFRRAALTRFVALPESALERREKLEQLRALEAGMRIDVALVDAVPPGVDTPADLERARAELAP